MDTTYTTPSIPRLSSKERLILELLISRHELYGLEMVKISDGMLKRGTVYVTLQRMAEKGYVESTEVLRVGRSGLPRRVFRVTELGERVHQAWRWAEEVWMLKH